MENKYRKIGENERISLYVDKTSGENEDGFLIFVKKTGKMLDVVPTDPTYGDNIMEILASLPDEDE